ncbi:hypothetical protein Ddc_14878 [Ditylenchus destructor]|nr:hypothetical protein Ddc_14878 [Ditylenchus destructor]
MPIPKPFVRFQKVYIYRLLGKSTLKFLRDAKESFVGSAIHYSMTDILDNKDMRNQMHYLLQNVFQKPSHISVEWLVFTASRAQSIHRRHSMTKISCFPTGRPNCSRIKLQLWGREVCNDDTIRMLLDWLSNVKSMVQNPQRDTVQKHLELDCFPRWFILELVQQVKNAFNDEDWLFSDFVITFVSNEEKYYCLEGDHKFTLNKLSTNERLSFFTHSRVSCYGSGQVYRLWCRRVVNEPEELKLATHLRNFEKLFRLGIDLDNNDFYDFCCPNQFGW